MVEVRFVIQEVRMLEEESESLVFRMLEPMRDVLSYKGGYVRIDLLEEVF